MTTNGTIGGNIIKYGLLHIGSIEPNDKRIFPLNTGTLPWLESPLNIQLTPYIQSEDHKVLASVIGDLDINKIKICVRNISSEKVDGVNIFWLIAGGGWGSYNRE